MLLHFLSDSEDAERLRRLRTINADAEHAILAVTDFQRRASDYFDYAARVHPIYLMANNKRAGIVYGFDTFDRYIGRASEVIARKIAAGQFPSRRLG